MLFYFFNNQFTVSNNGSVFILFSSFIVTQWFVSFAIGLQLYRGNRQPLVITFTHIMNWNSVC